jgi:predicted acyltransferase
MASALPTRLTGLDLFRGTAVAGMIIVNTPGSGDYVWWPLDHARWNGFTPTDLVFPAFLFAVGVALALSFPRIVDAALWHRVARRTASLIALGWAWQMLARPGLETFRLMGVLPRIGLCYGIVAAFVMLTAPRDADGGARLDPRLIGGAALLILAVYAVLMLFVPVPGYGAGQLTPEGNLASYVDQMVLTPAHMWRYGTDAAGRVVYDPEGLLSTLPSLANVLFGMLAAIVWQRAPDRAIAWIALGGVVLTVAGLLLAPAFPINKRLWSSSYALFSSGLSALLLALTMSITQDLPPSSPRRRGSIDADGATLSPGSEVLDSRLRGNDGRKGARMLLGGLLAPLYLLGMNAILGYMLSLLLALAGTRFYLGGTTLNAHAFAAMHIIAPDPYLASFLCALAVLALVIGLLVPLHRRGIHLRL